MPLARADGSRGLDGAGEVRCRADFWIQWGTFGLYRWRQAGGLDPGLQVGRLPGAVLSGRGYGFVSPFFFANDLT